MQTKNQYSLQKWTIDLNVKHKAIKLLQENGKVDDLEHSNDLTDSTEVAVYEITEKQEFIKIKNLLLRKMSEKISHVLKDTRLGADCVSDRELLIAKFRLKLKKVGKTTRPFRYDLN